MYKKEINPEVLKIQQGNMGEKIACNVFVRQNRFKGFTMGTYHQFDMIVESENGDANVQIKTLVPFVKERYWSISGEKTVENFLNADEAYIISIPVRLNDTTDAHLWKFQGRMLRVNLDELRKQRGTSMLIIPMDEEVEEYYDLTEEETLSLLKYPVSYFTIKPSEWNQKSKMKYSTQILAK